MVGCPAAGAMCRGFDSRAGQKVIMAVIQVKGDYQPGVSKFGVFSPPCFGKRMKPFSSQVGLPFHWVQRMREQRVDLCMCTHLCTISLLLSGLVQLDRLATVILINWRCVMSSSGRRMEWEILYIFVFIFYFAITYSENRNYYLLLLVEVLNYI